jgi:hypothetical protein
LRTTYPPRPPPHYSETPGSAFHSEALECYRVAAELTPEQQAIARFWSDDPGRTSTPPGHSISILTEATRALDLSLDRAAEAYAKGGIAVADAFIHLLANQVPIQLASPGHVHPPPHRPQPDDTARHRSLRRLPIHRSHSRRDRTAATLLPLLHGRGTRGGDLAAGRRHPLSGAIERGFEQGISIGRCVTALG